MKREHNQISGTVFIDCGGPMHAISVGGEILRFEMHPYCGPNILKPNGEPIDNQPHEFLKAASLWAQQGEKVRNGLCVWYHPSEPITEHLGGNNFKIVGMREAVRGE